MRRVEAPVSRVRIFLAVLWRCRFKLSYGGMENPRLTFVTPCLLAGDQSLADVVAHEIAHSWYAFSTVACFLCAWDGGCLIVELKLCPCAPGSATL